MLQLRANTAVDVLIGPFVDLTDGYTAEEGESPSVYLSKNGQALAAKNDATTPVHDDAGYYNCELDATDTNTEGQLVLIVEASANALPVRHEFNVLAEAAWDSMYIAKDDGYMDVNIKAISEDTDAANALESYCDGTTPQPVNVMYWYSGAVPEPSETGVPEVDITYVGGSAASGVATVDANVVQWKGDTAPAMTGDAYAAVGSLVTTIGTPADTDIATDIAAVKAETALILEDTGTTLPGTLTTIAGYVDCLPASWVTVPTAEAITDAVWDEALAGHTTPGTTGAIVTAAATNSATIITTIGTPAGASVSADLVVIDNFVDDLETRLTATRAGYLDNLSAAVATAAELAKVPKSDSTVSWNATALAAIQSECNDAIVANNLDHLALTGDATLTNIVADNTVFAHLLAIGADISDYDASTDSLEAIGAGGAAPTAAAIADAVLDEALSEHTTPGTTGAIVTAAATNSSAIITTLGSPAGASVSADIAAAVETFPTNFNDLSIEAMTGAITLRASGITATKFDSSTAFPITSADTGVTRIARTGADSDTLETLSDEIAVADAVADAIKLTTDKIDTMIEAVT